MIIILLFFPPIVPRRGTLRLTFWRAENDSPKHPRLWNRRFCDMNGIHLQHKSWWFYLLFLSFLFWNNTKKISKTSVHHILLHWLYRSLTLLYNFFSKLSDKKLQIVWTLKFKYVRVYSLKIITFYYTTIFQLWKLGNEHWQNAMI